MEGRGTLVNRVSLTAGIGHARIEGFASRYSPRLSVAAYLRTPTAREFWGDTRLTFNAGQGVKATSARAVNSSLYTLLQRTPAGAALADSAGIGPIGPERGRNLDVGIEQGMWGGRARARVAYFNNEFFDLIEFVSRNLLTSQFGIPPDVAAAAGFGAYVNSQSFKAKGVEMSLDATAGRLRFAGSYSTWTPTSRSRCRAARSRRPSTRHFPASRSATSARSRDSAPSVGRRTPGTCWCPTARVRPRWR